MAAQDVQNLFDNAISSLMSYVSQGYTNLLNNARAFINMSGLQWIRIITIIGAYLLIRPYLQKAATKGAMKKQEEALNSEDVQQRKMDRELEKMDIITPNILRGISDKKVELPEDSDSEGEGKATGADAKWGSKERKRQRQLVKKIIMQEEKARREARDVGTFYSDEDKDIEEYLS